MAQSPEALRLSESRTFDLDLSRDARLIMRTISATCVAQPTRLARGLWSWDLPQGWTKRVVVTARTERVAAGAHVAVTVEHRAGAPLRAGYRDAPERAVLPRRAA